LINPAPKPRRWTVIASGLLCGILAVIVFFTSKRAFFSPLAVMVVGAIGLAAVLIQLRLRNQEQPHAVRSPLGLNFLGVLLALAAFLSDLRHWGAQPTEILALGAVMSFAVSGAMILHAFRKQRIASK
jgi:drug/metabolite transporter (DMT)-like permease